LDVSDGEKKKKEVIIMKIDLAKNKDYFQFILYLIIVAMTPVLASMIIAHLIPTSL